MNPRPRPRRCPAHRAASGLFAFLLLLGSSAAGAASFYAGGDLDPAIPSPEGFLGYPAGSRFTPHHRVVDYLKALADASDRVEIEQYGESYEGRPLLLLTVSDPQNLAAKDRIKESYARLADPRRTSEGEARGISRDLPIAVWLSYNIHGDEASGSETAIAVAYRLAAARDPETTALLKSTVVLIDPCLNPDGRDRYVNWMIGVTGGRPDPLPPAREHHQPWPGGRYNHYLFDLNRDWAWLTQVETRARAAVYLGWRPQVHVDVHEMYAQDSYFFFPPERPIHPYFPPETLKWATIFGRGNAAAFDGRGWAYYTEESFDLYYPGYGDSWPSFHGAIGMTYEQAGHGFAGTTLVRAPGDTLTLAMRAEHHYVASLATLRTAAANREARLLDFHRFFEADRPGPAGAYFFPPGADPARVAELASLLMAHGAEVYRARGEIHPRGLHAYDGTPASTTLPVGTFVVPLDQPLHRFLRAILEPEAALPDTFFYDVSAWSLPLAFGVDAFTSEEAIDGNLERLTESPTVTGRVEKPEARYAFLIPWDRNGAARAAAWLQERNVRLRFATREFRMGAHRFPPGTLVIFRAENGDGLSALLAEAAALSGADIFGVNTGLTDDGPDLGSFRVPALKQPRVAVIGDAPASPTSSGACWFLLDRLYGVPYSLMRLDEIDEEALSRYSVLVFPNDNAGGRAYAAALDSTQVETLKHWVHEGGVFVGLGGGAFFAGADVSGLSSVKEAPPAEKEREAGLTEDERKSQDRDRRLETQTERERRERLSEVPGTIFRVSVDPLHPLGFGYTGEARVLKISDRALELGPPGTNVAWFTRAPRVSGYASPENVDRLVDRPFLVDEPVGRGHVVMYVEDPNFRLSWYGLNRLFLNSIYFLPSLSE
jgi:hypothetical protein